MNIELEEREVVAGAAKMWWVFLLTGIAWLVFALAVFQWDFTTVYAVSYLFGFVALLAGLNEFFSLTTPAVGAVSVRSRRGSFPDVIARICAGIAPRARRTPISRMRRRPLKAITP